MQLERISSLNDERVSEYRNVRDSDLLKQRGLFMAEGRLVVRALLRSSRFTARSVFVTEPALASLGDALKDAAIPVYVAEQGVMDDVVGFHIHRGALAAGVRPEPIGAADVLTTENAPATVIVLEDLTNHDNVGGIFRCAAAFGARAVLLSPRCCDPLYRKAIRVSMGAALDVPFATIDPWPRGVGKLKEYGFSTAALTPHASAGELRAFAGSVHRSQRVALLLGAEGSGLSKGALSLADHHVRIEMAGGVDSLNVVTAAAIAMHELYGRLNAVH